MNISKVTVRKIESSSLGWVVAAHIEGENLSDRAAPLIVKFGDITASNVVPLLRQEGVRALFTQMPPDGAPLSIGYADGPISVTRFKFVEPGGPPPVA